MLSTRVLFAAGIVASLAGCSAGAEKEGSGVSTDTAELKSSMVDYLGPIAAGETKTTAYSSPPRYQAYGFSAKGGDKITIDVKSSDGGDAVAWLTTAGYSSLLSNDDASSSTLDSHIEYTVPASVTKRSYRIVFRDYDLFDATFSVSVSIEGAPPACDPSQEPWRVYKGTPATCPTIRYTCTPETKPFENACGCGCE